MKQFLKYCLASLVGVAAFTAILMVLGVIVITSVAVSAMGTEEVKVPKNAVLALDLSGSLSERTDVSFFETIRGEAQDNISLCDILDAIDRAKNCDNVKGMYIEAGDFLSDSPASSAAIRDKILEFRKAGKWVVAYGDVYTQTTYYICSAADKVFLNPQGMVYWHGLASEPMLLKDMLAKFGVRIQLSKVGKYKSAPEMYTASETSEANREQIAAYVGGIWQQMTKAVAASRRLTVADLNAAADNMVTFAAPTDYVKMGFVDALMYTDGVKPEINKLLKRDADKSISQLSVSDMLATAAPEKKGGEVAVYYCFGDVEDAPSTGYNAKTSIAASTVCPDLADLADDDDVRAVVLRINSGGGSAYASEQIWHAVMKLKEKKPVVVSMGGMAASGAYYISAPANYIFAEPSTLTGSIGIFGMFPDYSGLLTEKLGIKFSEPIATNKFSAFGTMSRPFNEAEMAILNAYIDRGYKLFRSRVAQGRRMPVDKVEAIAQGRVWLATDAKKVGLVDAFGNLDAAVAKAAQLAKLKEYHKTAYPEPLSVYEQLLNTTLGGRDNYIDGRVKAALGDSYAGLQLLTTLDRQNAIQARLPFILNINQ